MSIKFKLLENYRWFRLLNYATELMSYRAQNKPFLNEVEHLFLSIFLHYGLFKSLCFVAMVTILLYITNHDRFT